MNNQGALKHLTDEQFTQFMDVYLRHFNVWETPERKEQFALENIEKIDWIEEEKVFHVHYKETQEFTKEWFHYDPEDGTWY